MYAPFIPFARKLLAQHHPTLTFVDVGSRNGVLELPNLADHVLAYGFEPNPEEFRKLQTGNTDAAPYGFLSPAYQKLRYFPYAISDHNGKGTLQITRGPGAVGLQKPEMERLRHVHFRGSACQNNFADDIFTVEKTVEVELKTLAHCAEEYHFAPIDYLKIDVDGHEYEVFQGAGKLLDQVGVVKVEVCFVPMREGQKLFSEVDLLLREHGLELLRYEILPEQIGFKERTSPWSFGPKIGIPEQFGHAMQADAIYVNRRILSRERMLVQALILLEKNYLDEALFILKQAGVHDELWFQRLQNYRGSWRTRLLNGLISLYTRLPRL